ncbi:uncharacterized protein LOC130712775 [Lotus japonicus]|uniref:uncharacterized protein LOC130712775 n=1 Tax=Lotus japonicus TaxID=34305 RepID=UPI00259029E0|nr:uncharacterized protein LOC130712775 [Lotus japonicus]
MSQASGKKDSVKAKVEITPLGGKCMGLKSGSSKKDYVKKKARTPARKAPSNVPVYEDVTNEEEVSAENSPVGPNQDVVPDARASDPEDVHDQEISGKETSAHEDSGLPTQSHGSTSPSKEEELVYVSIDESQSKESSKAPASVQNISDDDSDDVPLTTSLPDSVAARIKRKRRVPDVDESPAPKKKSKTTPATSKSKPVDVKGKGKQKEVNTKSSKKKKVLVAAEESESDVEEDVEDILPSEKKKYAGKRIPQCVPDVRIDNVSFHAEGNVQKWKFVCQRRIAKEREVDSDVLECNAVEFVDEELSLDVIAKEITAGQVKKWPIKKLLSTGNLSVKYAILNRIGAVNWVPTQHTFGVSATLAKLIYRIGTSTDFDFGSFVFEQTLKHADTCAMKLPVSFPYLLTEIILQQHPQIIKADEVSMPKGVPITLDHRLFMEPHVPNIAVPSSRTSAPASETIKISTARKLKVDVLLLKLQEEDSPGGEPSGAATTTHEASTEEEEGSEESIEETEEDSSSEE